MGRRPRKLLIDEGLPGCIRERLHDDGYTLILAQELGKGLSDEELLAYAAQEKDIDMNTELLVMASNDGTIQAFDAETGSSRWQWRSNHPFGGPALARVGDAVIAMSLDGSLVALDFADGSVRWESLLPESVPLGSPMYGLRVVANEDRLVVQQGACYFGVDTNDGHVHWISGSPRAVQGPWLLAVGQKHAYLAQLDAPFPKPPSTPAPERTDPTHSPHAWTPPVFVTTSLSTWDGSIQWSWREQSAGPQPWDGATSLTEGDGVVYIFGHGLNAFDADTHRLVWSNDEAPNLDIGSVAIAHDQLIVVVGSHLGAYRRDSGALLWSETGQHRADGYFESFSGLVVLGDVVYVGRGSNGPRAFQIEARTPDTGAIKWVWPTDDTRLRFDISWRFCGAGETLYVPSLDTIWAIRASDGAQRWSHAYTSQFDAFLAISTNDTGI